MAVPDPSRLLPHRPPFLLLDRVVEVVPGERGRAIQRVTSGEPMGAPPWPLVLEACAQLVAVVSAAAGEGAGGGSARGYLAAVEGFEVFRPVAVGDSLELSVVLGRRLQQLLQAEVRAAVDGEMVAAGRLTVALARAGGGAA